MAKKKSNAGRPTVMTPEVVAKLEDAYRYGATDIEACFYANISKDALYDYQNKYPEFSERKKALRSHLKFVSKNVVGRSIEGGDTTDAKWYLERKCKDEFGTKQNIEHSGNITLEAVLKELDGGTADLPED